MKCVWCTLLASWSKWCVFFFFLGSRRFSAPLHAYFGHLTLTLTLTPILRRPHSRPLSRALSDQANRLGARRAHPGRDGDGLSAYH